MKTLRNISLLLITLITISSCNQQDPSALLEYTRVQNQENAFLATGWYLLEEDTGFKRNLKNSDESYFVNPKPFIVKEFFDIVELYNASSTTEPEYAVSIRIHRLYKGLWANATEKYTGKRVGFVINNSLVSTPKIMGRINNGMCSFGQGQYSKEELEAWMKEINL